MDGLLNLLYLAVGIVLGSVLGALWKRRRQAGAGAPPVARAEVARNEVRSPAAESGLQRLYQLAESLRPEYGRISHPRDLEAHPLFREAIGEFVASDLGTEDLLRYYRGDSPILACLATVALAERESDSPDEVIGSLLASISYPANYVQYLALQTIHRRADRPVVTRVLRHLDSEWEQDFLVNALEDFLKLRREAGEALRLDDGSRDLATSRLQTLQAILGKLPPEVGGSLLEDVRARLAGSVDREFLGGFGKILTEASEAEEFGGLVAHEYLARVEEMVLRSLISDRSPRSVLLVGRSGVGKTAASLLLARSLRERGYTVFRAGAPELLAGRSYIGELEQRVQDLVRQLAGKKAIWVTGAFQDLALAGRHRYSGVSILDMVLPHIESGALKVVGELRPAAFEKLVVSFPRLHGVLVAVRMEELEERPTLEVARAWASECPAVHGARPELSEESLREAFQLVKQFLPSRAAPGNLMEFLKLTWTRLAGELRAGEGRERIPITADDCVVTMAQLTGMPLEIVDERESFDLDRLSRKFHRRVLGQPEAADALVERVAMIKAGVSDPSRPLGVFFFSGPTGSGKTEIAKALTRFLFGSEDRMIRLDMSEFQSGGVSRLLGETGRDDDRNALVHQIRRQPFSLILLDEFEKADPSIWDLFLQVFDDGRLTDSRGNTADFRNAIIIMTSNLGSTEAHGPGLGFVQGERGYSEEEILQAIRRTFRREFVNRIDRVVVFRPLSRRVMREILKLELESVFRRRGLRNRPWAVDWDESTLEFLLDRGFSPELGARPLRRAVERYLLTPLSVAMVKGELPAGDQFLLVRAGVGKLEFQCIDPDAGEAEAVASAAVTDSPVPAAALRTPRLILEARGTRVELNHLAREYGELVELLKMEAVVEKKEEALARMSAADFWESSDRFRVLSYVEYLERVEESVRSTGELLERLQGRVQESGTSPSPVLIRRLAQKIYLLEAAYPEIAGDSPRDAFVRVEASGAGPGKESGRQFARRLADMYLRWAAVRGMTARVLTPAESSGGDGDDGTLRVLLGIEGYAAHAILGLETGLHMLENPGTAAGPAARAVVKVRVVPQPSEPPGVFRLTLREQAERALADTREEEMHVVRRYQEKPSPLVRDRVRGWRTGRLDLVLEGNFDII